VAVYNSPDKDKDKKIHSKNNDKVLFIATVYTYLAAFHIPFMKMLQEKGYEVHAAASSVTGRRDDVENAGAI
jgi:hypothetical protein